MSAKDYIAFVFDEISELKEKALDKKPYSDTVDSDGNQYVDLVLEGGGVLGVALLGYLYVLEQAGLRFLGLGGTSAGSITALITAAIDEPAKPKALRIIDLLADMPMMDFVDGDQDAREFVEAMLKDAGWLRLAWKAGQVVDNIFENLGLNPGVAFRNWMERTLDTFGVTTLEQLRVRMASLPEKGLFHRDTLAPIPFDPDNANLCLIAADISTETRVEFPRMAKLYWEKPDQIHPAEFVRASMSVPFFFHPYRIDNIPRGPEQKQLWRELAGFDQHNIKDRKHVGDWLPNHCILVDGGVMSNFPIDAFHRSGRVPRRPTFGVKLQWDDRNHYITQPETFIAQLLNSARHTLDYEFIKRNPDFSHLVAFIDTADHNWLDFSLSNEAKQELFKRGARSALDFLEHFDWPAYKKLREGVAQAQLASDAMRQTKLERIERTTPTQR